MRVGQIVSEKAEVIEAPAGALRQMGRKIGSRALNAIGAKSSALAMAGRADAGDTANDLFNDLNKYVGQTGKNINSLDAADLTKWLRSKGAPTGPMQGVTGVLNKKQIDGILLKVAQKAFEVGGDEDGNAAGAPTAGAAPIDANKDGKDDKTGKPIAKTAGTTTEIPAEIKAKVEKLTPEQKKQLLGML